MRQSPAHQLTLDGSRLRADAKPFKPGVILSFTRTTGDAKQDVNFPCDTYLYWQDNFRAIVKSLEALRAVERHGVFKYNELVSRLGLPSADGKLSSKQAAAALISEMSNGFSSDQILADTNIRKAAYREAARKAHPDSGGSTDTFQMLVDANTLLEAQ